jgi:hypothetical protein
MKAFYKFSIMILVLLVLTLPIGLAQDVNVGLYILNLGKFDVATGSFTADFYLSMTCKDPCTSDKFEFMNGRATSIDKVIDLPNEKFYRIQANLNSPVDLQRFPYDSQLMQIVIEDKENTIQDLRYVPIYSQSGIDNGIAFIGWNIDGWNAIAKEHEYRIYNETYSQYTFTIKISRIAISSFFKTFLPVLVIMLIVLFSFLMDPDKITTRLSLVTSSLVASVMFHISIANQIPPVGYLTTADKFMVLTYIILLFSAILNVIMLELLEQKKTALVEKIHRRSEYSAFVVVPIAYILFFVLSSL